MPGGLINCERIGLVEPWSFFPISTIHENYQGEDDNDKENNDVRLSSTRERTSSRNEGVFGLSGWAWL